MGRRYVAREGDLLQINFGRPEWFPCKVVRVGGMRSTRWEKGFAPKEHTYTVQTTGGKRSRVWFEDNVPLAETVHGLRVSVRSARDLDPRLDALLCGKHDAEVRAVARDLALQLGKHDIAANLDRYFEWRSKRSQQRSHPTQTTHHNDVRH